MIKEINKILSREEVKGISIKGYVKAYTEKGEVKLSLPYFHKLKVREILKGIKLKDFGSVKVAKEGNLLFVRNLVNDEISIWKIEKENTEPRFICLYYRINPDIFTYLNYLIRSGKDILIKGVGAENFAAKLLENTKDPFFFISKNPRVMSEKWIPLIDGKKEVIEKSKIERVVLEGMKESAIDKSIVKIGEDYEKKYDVVVEVNGREIRYIKEILTWGENYVLKEKRVNQSKFALDAKELEKLHSELFSKV